MSIEREDRDRLGRPKDPQREAQRRLTVHECRGCGPGGETARRCPIHGLSIWPLQDLLAALGWCRFVAWAQSLPRWVILADRALLAVILAAWTALTIAGWR